MAIAGAHGVAGTPVCGLYRPLRYCVTCRLPVFGIEKVELYWQELIVRAAIAIPFVNMGWQRIIIAAPAVALASCDNF